jgi:hypothetical protein
MIALGAASATNAVAGASFTVQGMDFRCLAKGQGLEEGERQKMLAAARLRLRLRCYHRDMAMFLQGPEKVEESERYSHACMPGDVFRQVLITQSCYVI